METAEPPILINVIVLLAVVSVLLAWGNNRWGSPVVAIANRWLRWLVFAVGLALVSRELGWTARPFWILAVSSFLIWFLGETVFNWLAINALSQSSIPLFPRFSDNSHVQEWPAQERFFRIREWLRTQKFSQVQSLKSDLGMGLLIRSFVFQSSDKLTRVQILFVPQRSGSVSECFSFHSLAEDGTRLITDNLYIPFGGFYPEDWQVARKAWIRSMARLHRLHQKRINKMAVPMVEWEETPLDDLNYQQLSLERLNTELGFLHPYHLREEHGKITSEGRYRVWKEVWFLNYLGKSTSA